MNVRIGEKTKEIIAIMSREIEVDVTCPACLFKDVVPVYTSVNVSMDPDLRDRVFDDELNRFTCANCGKRMVLPINLMYHDMDLEFAVWFSPQGEMPEEEKNVFDRVAQSMGIGDYLSKAPTTFKWEDFKNKILEFEELA
jgi:predicted RNA-binding Zn-ribbon protein involved in translation (DUF1610 family)